MVITIGNGILFPNPAKWEAATARSLPNGSQISKMMGKIIGFLLIFS